MSASSPPPFARRRRLPLPGGRLAAAALALLVATPVLATVWTRSSVQLRIPKGARATIEDVSDSGRDWTISVTALEVREETRPGPGLVSITWTFHYTNTDKEPHYAALTVRCLDVKRGERARFSANVVLQAETSDGGKFEIRAKMDESAWRDSSSARVVVDFLSDPTG